MLINLINFKRNLGKEIKGATNRLRGQLRRK